MIEEIKKARRELQAVEEGLYLSQNRLRAKESALIGANRLGGKRTDNAGEIEREIADLKEAIERSKSTLQATKGNLSELVARFVLPQSPRQLISQLDDSLPFLLFPVRLETRFMSDAQGRELWVRVYPDDIAVHTHEKDLTRSDADSGVEYWIQRAIAEPVTDAAEREQLEKGAWRALVNSHGGTRASWIASEIKKRTIDKEGTENFSFMLIKVEVASILADRQRDSKSKRTAIESLLNFTHPFVAFIRKPILNLLDADPEIGDASRQSIMGIISDGILLHLGFDIDELKAESWSRAPRTEVMPDRFVLVGFTGSAKLEQPFPRAVANPLILGPNPQNLESDLSQQGGDLVMGEDFEWIANFDKAIKVGMAMRVRLAAPFATQGFDRLMVLGIRVSSTAADHKALLEELIENHRFSPEGMGFLPQGTPTNHTAEGRSGFSTDDAEGEASFETETQEPVLDTSEDERKKTDAKRLSEAWDVSLESLASLANANRKEISQAKIINRALWPATLGYYLDELLQLEDGDIGNVRKFFANHVVARGSLPAIRVGKQPYGILVTSAFRRWQVNPQIDGEDFSFLAQAHDKLKKVEDQWQQLVPRVAHVDAPGDSFANLLNMLGLHATSVDFTRRLGTYETMLWNLAHFWFGQSFPGGSPIANYFAEVTSRGIALVGQLGFNFPQFPKLFGLFFSSSTSSINGPLIDDVESAEDEKLSETAELPAKYAVRITGEEFENRNYIGWLIGTDINTLKQQQFRTLGGETLPIPTALLYRMLHRSVLLSTYEASMNVYTGFQLLDNSVRRELNFTNIEAARTVTRWEFMEANVGRVLPQLGSANVALGDFLATADVAQVPAAFTLQEVRESIGDLEHLKTAELERLFAEHLDLCSYRLDAWQTAIFAHRLDRLNKLRGKGDKVSKRGLHLGAYGWLENVRPAPPATPVSVGDIPVSLREAGVTVVEQPDNGGYIHGPSINHAVAAAVLRNAYLTHADQANAEHFAVRLTSERVRTALSFLEGVRNGQQLGALLGYQFERALHDRYIVQHIAPAQFILAFRKKYPLVADKITPGGPGDAIDRKESYQVVDGYALLEAVMLESSPLSYPYGVVGLPPATSAAGQAIITEVERLKETLDSIADLLLAEGVFQVTQGNYERAGAVLKALSEGNAAPDPEVIRTPRSGAVVNHKVAVHLQTGAVASPWSNPATPRSLAAAGLNKWLGDLIGPPESLQFSVHYDLDNSTEAVSLTELNLQPLDLIHLIGSQASGIEVTQEVSDLTELEARIDFAYRRRRKAEDPNFDPSGRVTILFMSRNAFPAADPTVRTLFELLPLLRNLQKLVAGSRQLGADDYMLPSEEKTDPASAENPKRWDLAPLEASFDQAAAALDNRLQLLEDITATFPPNALSKDPVEAGDLSGVNYDALRNILVSLSYFGLPGAFPKNGVLPELASDATDEQRLVLLRAQQSLIEQGLLTLDQGRSRHSQAVALRTFSDLTTEQINRLSVVQKAESYQSAGALILGDAFRFVPTFQFKNSVELQAAHSFSNEVAADESLLRFTQSRLRSAASSSAIDDWRDLAVEEWFAGVGAVREKIGLIDRVNTYREAFADEDLRFAPLQLPFNTKAHWVALEFPEVTTEQLDDPDVFVPQGDFLSVVRHLPSGYNASAPQSGLLIDEWNEVIPNRIETTGIAIHYNQPNTEPPQCLLMAVSPNVNGRWEWDDLVETITDTFERAKRRAVEPDFLRTTPYAQLLPAVLSSFTSYPFATISTNMAVQPATMVFEQT